MAGENVRVRVRVVPGAPIRNTGEDTETTCFLALGRTDARSRVSSFFAPRLYLPVYQRSLLSSSLSLNGAIAQYWAIQRWSHTKLRRVSPVPSRVPPMCPLSARSPPRSIAPSGGPKHAVWAEIWPAACRRRRRNWPLCGLSGRRGGLHSQITGGEEWEKISKKSTLTYRRNSQRVIWFN